jgi:hypothetical protein
VKGVLINRQIKQFQNVYFSQNPEDSLKVELEDLLDSASLWMQRQRKLKKEFVSNYFFDIMLSSIIDI